MHFMVFVLLALRLRKRDRGIMCGQKEPSAAQASGLVFGYVYL